MRKSERWLMILCASLLVLTAAGTASAQNVLVNPGMEDGPTGYGVQGWTVFGNVYTEADNGWPFAAYEGTQMMSFFGTWCGAWCVSGMFQEFEVVEGTELIFSCKSRHHDGDPMLGSKADGGNWVVQKLAFFDAGGVEFDGVEADILDGSWATEVWHDNAPIITTAPAGTVKVQALILYIQPAADGGSCQIDNADLQINAPVGTEETSFDEIKAMFR